MGNDKVIKESIMMLQSKQHACSCGMSEEFYKQWFIPYTETLQGKFSSVRKCMNYILPNYRNLLEEKEKIDNLLESNSLKNVELEDIILEYVRLKEVLSSLQIGNI